MGDNIPASNTPRDRVAECHDRAAADRLQAEAMDTSNGRRKFEESAATWDQRAALLGRLDASFNKREQLDAAAQRFQSSLEEEAPDGPAPDGTPASGGQG